MSAPYGDDTRNPLQHAQTGAPVPPSYAPYYQYNVSAPQQVHPNVYNNQFNGGQPPYYAQPAPQPQQSVIPPGQPTYNGGQSSSPQPQASTSAPASNNNANSARVPVAAAPATEAYYDYTEPQTVQEMRVSKGSNEWATGMWSAPCAEPGMCFCAFICPCCCTFLQRRRLLMNNWDNYRCCAGTCRFGWCCPCLKKQGCGVCSPCCLALETMFCLGCAVFANRYMVKSHYKVKDECCDTCILWSACICNMVARCVRDNNVNKLADCWYSVVLSCMIAQGDHQMNTFGYPKSKTMK